MPFRILILALPLMLTGCQEGQSNHLPSSHTPNTYSVLVAQVEERALPVIYPVPGTVVSKDQLQLASRITGYIEQISVDEGDVVEPGAVLVKIDGAQAEAAIKSAEAALASARAELQDAKDDAKRYQVLAKTQTLAEDQLRDTLVRRTKAEATLAQARAELEAKRQDWRYIHLTSPVRAQVRERLRDQGDLATAGEPILRFDVLGSMELEIFLSSTQIGSVVEGQKIDVYIQSYDNSITGEVSRIVRSADRVTRRSKVRIALPNVNTLYPGQFGRAHIVLGQERVLLVPVAAMVERAGIEGVFVTEENGVVRFRSIRAGKGWQDYREVLAGVEVGISVVLNPPARLRDGDRVKRATSDGS